ncbi:hypothetical protein PAF17_14475 [Paracoccus sp. Z330]|uniref:Uncharacterized protein n=1 Tax=Paracoccus onchidii TaxID=3017813 RepID=A0ABT4ZH87_9RHOB|nr:hypothetical protein [Paracoccus onchidii]MDB6178700.1 hypothetical protein [Paracoccus onchidii]
MAQTSTAPNTAPHSTKSDIDAVLEQMFGYFSRDLPKAPAVPTRQ